MKKHLALTSIALIAVALLVTPAFSQSMKVRADIPFAFSADGVDMIAGSYSLTQDGASILWHTPGKGYATLAGVRSDRKNSRTCLVFRVAGDQYILTEIQVGNVARKFHLSKADEERLAREGTPREVAVLLYPAQ